MNSPTARMGIFASYRAKRQKSPLNVVHSRCPESTGQVQTDADADTKAERKRWATVLNSDQGKLHTATAISLLSTSVADSTAIIAVLNTLRAAPSAQDRFERRMAYHKSSQAAEAAEPKSAAEASTSIVAAYNRALGRGADV